MIEVDYDKLGQAVARAILSDPSRRELWDIEDISIHLRCSTSHAQKRYVCQPGFPTRIKIPYDTRHSKPLWVANEVRDWALAHKQTEGRPREN